MWKLISTVRMFGRQRAKCVPSVISPGRRNFLSNAYQCQEAWERRYQAPVLQNVKFEEFFHQLDQKYRRDGILSEIDIDVFANAVKEDTYVDELEELIHDLRMTPNTTKMLPSTSHAVVRYLLTIGKYDNLLRIIDDRLNYGIFPDDYCMCLMLDKFIKDGNFTGAAKVSAIHMLQEDWSNPLVSSLALYACHMYARSPCPWEIPKEEEDDGEEIKVRVAYLRNPFFDDHFDLQDPQLLVGKTLYSIGATMPNLIGQTYHLVGLGFYKKWEKVVSYLQWLLSDSKKPAVYKEGIKLLEEVLEKEASVEKGSLESEVKDNICLLLKELDSKGLVTLDDLHTAVLNKVKEVVSSQEKQMIEQQQNVYSEWETTRDTLFQRQLEALDRQQRLATVQQEKERLIKKEQELFFFDKEDELDLLIEKNELIKLEQIEKQPKHMKKQQEEETYIPPEV